MGASSISMTRLWRGGRGVGTKVGASTEMGFDCRVGEASRRDAARLVWLWAKILEGIRGAVRRLVGPGVGLAAGRVGGREVGRGALARRRAVALLMGLVTNVRVGRAGVEELDESSDFGLGARATGDGSKS
jgi:hypothetical protein